MKQINIKCPYCGSRAFLRPESVVYGRETSDPEAKLYVCARYPACDAYVSAHRRSHLPMGTLADKALRRKRIETHTAFSGYGKAGLCRKPKPIAGSRCKWACRKRKPTLPNFQNFAVKRSFSYAVNSVRKTEPSCEENHKTIYERGKNDEIRLHPYRWAAGSCRTEFATCKQNDLPIHSDQGKCLWPRIRRPLSGGVCGALPGCCDIRWNDCPIQYLRYHFDPQPSFGLLPGNLQPAKAPAFHIPGCR